MSVAMSDGGGEVSSPKQPIPTPPNLWAARSREPPERNPISSDSFTACGHTLTLTQRERESERERERERARERREEEREGEREREREREKERERGRESVSVCGCVAEGPLM